jgi:hypothetical protein
LLDALFRGFTVDGSTTFVPGDDYGQNQEEDAGAHDMRVFKDAITTHHDKFPHPPPGLLFVLSCNNFSPIALVHLNLILCLS